MRYYIYPSTVKIDDRVVRLEITTVQRDVRLFAEFECDDILNVALTGQAALFNERIDTSETILTIVD
ncbi:hypothetical protein [Raoultella planticola]|uniref:hypothetical protein n=1 Tax=Raoultella planticola TaxID=575 RepID=UPI0007E944F4|nr:hypothetical protein [Raoultella planticola]OAZ80978.1 hypothetical protein AYO05_21250 [Raoultella planticola]OAZ83679.1 hypothetical protein AYO04_19475 [Raoultella planticola]HEB4943771.1 hypothetical protein [Klebsiella quasipneumoniae]